MKFHDLLLLIFLVSLVTACGTDPQLPEPPAPTNSTGQYQYRVGLGYGFLGKHVQVSVDGLEILSLVGNEEIEQFAQLLGTKMLGEGSTDKQVVTVRVVVDGGPPIEQDINLDEGGFIHIYFQENSLQVFNTSELILE